MKNYDKNVFTHDSRPLFSSELLFGKGREVLNDILKGTYFKFKFANKHFNLLFQRVIKLVNFVFKRYIFYSLIQ